MTSPSHQSPPRGVIRAARSASRVVRDAWLILGISILLFVALEYAYRCQRAVREAVRKHHTGTQKADLPKHPYAQEPWFEEWERSSNGGGARYDPYRGYWGRPYVSSYVNVDSAGRRVTIQPERGPSKSRRVFMFGGSAMWGLTARDSFTIPSLVASRLHARGLTDVEVVNLAQSAHHITQEAITLLLELRRGNVPTVAVFFDGNNEVWPAFESGDAGHIFGETRAEQLFRLGGRGFWGELIGLGRHSALGQRLARLVRRQPLGYPCRMPTPSARRSQRTIGTS